jgi:hypothetical protein
MCLASCTQICSAGSAETLPSSSTISHQFDPPSTFSSTRLVEQSAAFYHRRSNAINHFQNNDSSNDESNENVISKKEEKEELFYQQVHVQILIRRYFYLPLTTSPSTLSSCINNTELYPNSQLIDDDSLLTEKVNENNLWNVTVHTTESQIHFNRNNNHNKNENDDNDDVNKMVTSKESDHTGNNKPHIVQRPYHPFYKSHSLSFSNVSSLSTSFATKIQDHNHYKLLSSMEVIANVQFDLPIVKQSIHDSDTYANHRHDNYHRHHRYASIFGNKELMIFIQLSKHVAQGSRDKSNPEHHRRVSSVIDRTVRLVRLDRIEKLRPITVQFEHDEFIDMNEYCHHDFISSKIDTDKSERSVSSGFEKSLYPSDHQYGDDKEREIWQAFSPPKSIVEMELSNRNKRIKLLLNFIHFLSAILGVSFCSTIYICRDYITSVYNDRGNDNGMRESDNVQIKCDCDNVKEEYSETHTYHIGLASRWEPKSSTRRSVDSIIIIDDDDDDDDGDDGDDDDNNKDIANDDLFQFDSNPASPEEEDNLDDIITIPPPTVKRKYSPTLFPPHQASITTSVSTMNHAPEVIILDNVPSAANSDFQQEPNDTIQNKMYSTQPFYRVNSIAAEGTSTIYNKGNKMSDPTKNDLEVRQTANDTCQDLDNAMSNVGNERYSVTQSDIIFTEEISPGDMKSIGSKRNIRELHQDTPNTFDSSSKDVTFTDNMSTNQEALFENEIELSLSQNKEKVDTPERITTSPMNHEIQHQLTIGSNTSELILDRKLSQSSEANKAQCHSVNSKPGEDDRLKENSKAEQEADSRNNSIGSFKEETEHNNKTPKEDKRNGSVLVPSNKTSSAGNGSKVIEITYLDEVKLSLISSAQMVTATKRIEFVPPPPVTGDFKPSSELVSASKAIESPVWEFSCSKPSTKKQSSKKRDRNDDGNHDSKSVISSSAKKVIHTAHKRRRGRARSERSRSSNTCSEFSSRRNTIPRSIMFSAKNDDILAEIEGHTQQMACSDDYEKTVGIGRSPDSRAY